MLGSDDLIASIVLVFIGIVGIFVHIVEFVAIIRLSSKYNGFQFILGLSIVDILILIQYGLWPGVVILTENTVVPIEWKFRVHVYLDTIW